jgi:hypothetical protein
VALLHFGYSLAMLGFFARACQKIVAKAYETASGTEIEVSLWIYAAVTLVVFAPITWVRTLEVFQYGNVYSIIVVYLMIITITVFCAMHITENNSESGPGWEAFNNKEFVTMCGLAFFQYEGIGTLLPVMEASSARDSMIFLTIASLVTLFCSHVAFSEMIYYSYGHDLNEPIVIF